MKTFDQLLEESGEIGHVESITQSIINVSGLPSVRLNEVIVTEHGQRGIVTGIKKELVEAILLSSERAFVGQRVTRSGQTLKIHTSQAVLGRIVNPEVEPIDGLGPILGAQEARTVYRDAPGIASRVKVSEPLNTGVSLVDSVEWIILARNEAMADMKQLMHRYVKPRIVFKLDTEVDSKINAFKVKADKASNQGENLYIPMGAVEWELLSVPTNSTLSPLPWIDRLNQYFFQATGVPQIIVGGSSEFSESATKIALIAYEQLIAEEQLYIEEQVLSQLNLEIELDPPVSIQNELISDNQKAETIQATTPEDTSITNVGVNQGVPA